MALTQGDVLFSQQQPLFFGTLKKFRLDGEAIIFPVRLRNSLTNLDLCNLHT